RRLLLAATVFVAGLGGVFSDQASANTLTANFTFLNTAPNASGGSITFTLNGDKTIAATLTSTVGQIFSFGFNSNSTLSLLAFSPSLPGGFDTNGLPDYKSGFSCNNPCGTNSISWTIAGSFASVFDVLNGPPNGPPSFDFVMVAGDEFSTWNANA